MNHEDTLQEIEVSLEEAKRVVELGQSLKRLLENKEFKEVFLEEYFKENAVRLVGLKADPNMKSPEQQKSIDDAITAISECKLFIRKLQWQAEQASKAIADLHDAKSELLSGE